MNERDWLTTDDALAMLDHLFPVRGLDSTEPQSRPSRLYLLNCARVAWNRLPGVCRAVVAAGERAFCGRVRNHSLRDVVYPHAEALTLCRGEVEEVNGIGRALVALGLAAPEEVRVEEDIDPKAWGGFAHLAYFPFAGTTPHYRRVPAEFHSAALAREAFANPFHHHPRFDRRWRTETVLQLARHVESTGDFSVLPVLADALEDAGCARGDVLDHLRHGGPHARGCWAVELVLDEK
jgi:hypothetical protein